MTGTTEDSVNHGWYSAKGAEIRKQTRTRFHAVDGELAEVHPHTAARPSDIFYLSADTGKWVEVTCVTEAKDKGFYNFDDTVYVGRVMSGSCRHMTREEAYALNQTVDSAGDTEML